MRMLDSGGPIRQPDREQRHRDSRGIGEVVATFAEHFERMRGQPDCDQGAEQKQVQDKNDASSAGSSHVPRYRKLPAAVPFDDDGSARWRAYCEYLAAGAALRDDRAKCGQLRTLVLRT